jgi:hypothetical protein
MPKTGQGTAGSLKTGPHDTGISADGARLRHPLHVSLPWFRSRGMVGRHRRRGHHDFRLDIGEFASGQRRPGGVDLINRV